MKDTKTIICQKCGYYQEEPLVKRIALPNGGYHMSAYCSGCGRYIQHIKHAEPVLPFGKYKGKRIADIAKSDPGYLRYLLSVDIREGLRKTIQDALSAEVQE